MITKNARKFEAFIGGKTLTHKSLTRQSNYEGNVALLFEDYHSPHGGMYFGDIYIPAENIREDVHGNKFFISHKTEKVILYGQIDIVDNKGFGHITLNGKDYMLMIQPWATYFTTSISANANVIYDEVDNIFVFDPSSAQWQNAKWSENELEFAYAIYDDYPFKNIQTYFRDYSGDSRSNEITSIFEHNGNVLMSRDNEMVMDFTGYTPEPPKERKGNEIESVYPERALFKFDSLGSRFIGAYQDKNGKCYGIKGEVKLWRKENVNILEMIRPIEPFQISCCQSAQNLSIYTLVAMNPIKKNDDGYYDAPGVEAMQDFYDILLYYMDEGLRETYYGANPPTLDDRVRSIAMEDKEISSKYYKSLQIPFLAASLANYKSEYSECAKKINRIRAVNQLNTLTSNSDIYKKHSSELYRYRFEKMYPDIRLFLNDQKNGNYEDEIEKGIQHLKDVYIKQYENSAIDIESCCAQLDALEEYANGNGLYWAFMLYYYLLRTYIPNLQLKHLSGSLAQSLAEEIKNYVALFELLESDVKNKGDISFGSAFLESVRLAELTTILPQKADYTKFYEEYVESYEVIFKSFIEKYNTSMDENLKEIVDAMQAMLYDRKKTIEYFKALRIALASSSAGASWKTIITNFETIAGRTVQGITSSMVSAIGIGLAALVIGCIIFPHFNWSEMTNIQRINFISVISGAILGIIFIVGRSIGRLAIVWTEINGFCNCAKILFGTKSVIEMIDSSVNRLNSAVGKFLLRTDTATLPENASLLLRIFGRNATRFFASTIGAVLSVITLAMCAFDIAKSKTPMELAVNILGVAAATLQIVSISMNFALGIFDVTTGVLTTMCACIGALAAVAAVVGVILAIVLIFKQSTPPDPLQDFYSRNDMKEAGLQMPEKCAIEYISTSADMDEDDYSGYTIGIGEKSIMLNDEGKLLLKEFDYSTNMVWTIHASGNGNATISTLISEDNKTKCVYLCVDDTGNLSAAELPKMPEKNADGKYVDDEIKEYGEKLRRYQFHGECTKVRERVSELVFKANFHIYYMDAQNKKFYINCEGDNVCLRENKPFDLLFDFSHVGKTSLDYYPKPFRLIPEGKDQSVEIFYSARPLLTETKWSTNLSDDLSKFLQFEKHEDGCTIKQKHGVEIPSDFQDVKIQVTAETSFDDQIFVNECILDICVDKVG